MTDTPPAPDREAAEIAAIRTVLERHESTTNHPFAERAATLHAAGLRAAPVASPAAPERKRLFTRRCDCQPDCAIGFHVQEQREGERRKVVAETRFCPECSDDEYLGKLWKTERRKSARRGARQERRGGVATRRKVQIDHERLVRPDKSYRGQKCCGGRRVDDPAGNASPIDDRRQPDAPANRRVRPYDGFYGRTGRPFDGKYRGMLNVNFKASHPGRRSGDAYPVAVPEGAAMVTPDGRPVTAGPDVILTGWTCSHCSARDCTGECKAEAWVEELKRRVARLPRPAAGDFVAVSHGSLRGESIWVSVPSLLSALGGAR